MTEIGKRLRCARNLLNFSQEQLAHELGITKQAVSNMETGKSAPGIQTLNKLLTDYDININYIVSGVGDIVLTRKKSLSRLREAILDDVKEMLDSRGIC